MPSFMVYVDTPLSVPPRWSKLREEALAAFPGRFADCNGLSVNGAPDKMARLYLKDEGQPGDAAAWAAVIAAHNPAVLTTTEQQAADADTALADFLSDYDSLIATAVNAFQNWATLTAGQKDNINRQVLGAVIKLYKRFRFR